MTKSDIETNLYVQAAKLKQTLSHQNLSSSIKRLTTQELMNGKTEIEIDHDGALYRLRLTAQGKLILTK